MPQLEMLNGIQVEREQVEIPEVIYEENNPYCDTVQEEQHDENVIKSIILNQETPQAVTVDDSRETPDARNHEILHTNIEN